MCIRDSLSTHIQVQSKANSTGFTLKHSILSNRASECREARPGSDLAQGHRAIKHDRATLGREELLVFLCSCCELLGFLHIPWDLHQFWYQSNCVLVVSWLGLFLPLRLTSILVSEQVQILA